MIIRSGLIRKRDDVDFTQFSEHWRHVHGPLALQVAAMRAYRQNHILARRPSPHAARLHRVDGISQLWFDDIESMRVAMDSAEQRACVEDLHTFLDGVTIVVQQEGDTWQHGDASRLPAKFVYLLGGPDAALKALDEELFAVLAAHWKTWRFAPIGSSMRNTRRIRPSHRVPRSSTPCWKSGYQKARTMRRCRVRSPITSTSRLSERSRLMS
ncbi:EthD family reductase [Microvirga sp. BT688]|nr:EthD family reductase [Microvirga sp.]